MVATVEIDESNGAGETITHNVANINFGNADAPTLNITITANAILAGNNSFEKWLRFDVTGGTFNQIDNLKVWKSAGAFVSNESLKANLREVGYSQQTYTAPVTTTSTIATLDIPTSEPAGANLGIAGSLTGKLTAVGQSDYMIMQLQTTTLTPPGNVNQKTFTFQYDES